MASKKQSSRDESPPSLWARLCKIDWKNVLSFTGVLFASGVLLLGIVLWLGELCVVSSYTQAFEKGAFSSIGSPPTTIVPRPELHHELSVLLRPTTVRTYRVVVGASGVGKSTAIHTAASHYEPNSINGVVYFDVQKDDDIKSVLPIALNDLLARQSWFQSIVQFVARSLGFWLNKEQRLLPCTWDIMKKRLTATAEYFKSKNNRPMTLILDGIENVFAADKKFLDDLQGFAKDTANKHILQVVFVSSDFAILHYMRNRQSQWSRGNFFEVPELTHGQAVDYLTRTLRLTSADALDQASTVVREFTGGVLARLGRIDNVPTWFAQAKEIADADSRLAASLLETLLRPGHQIFSRMLDSPGNRLTIQQLVAIVRDSSVLDALVQKHIIAPHANEVYSFAAPYIKPLFEAYRSATPRINNAYAATPLINNADAATPGFQCYLEG
eukprot:GDKI01020514.1.p1 GENE.GDKI01020514.1~~GDKI01020514.1.p1  ORF type:complete len:442 (-),score=34.43 GDKI01020514.1:74-1399(-)